MRPVAALGVLATAIAFAFGGYWLGKSRGTEGNGAAARSSDVAAAPARKLLYYRNPMGLPDTSAVPKKDPMGMDYIAVYEGEEPTGDAAGFTIPLDRVQKLGVRTEVAAVRELGLAVRAAGRIEIDERRVHVVAPKFEGWVERLHVSATGQPVARGQPLFEVYSPELVSAQREYAIANEAARALKDAGGESQAAMRRLAESSLLRLRNWDIPPDQLEGLARSGEARRAITYRSPVPGIVMEKKAVQGMRFMPGEMLFQIADLSSVWVIADVFEQDLQAVKNGAPAIIRIGAYPDREFKGRVSFVYPTLKAETRSTAVRVELPNPDGALKPAMFAQVEIDAGDRRKSLAVPASALIDSGVRQVILVQLDEGRFDPREVKVGRRSSDFVEVLGGVKEGESVVVAANFLIDAESNLKAAIGSFGHAHGATTAPAGAAPPAGAPAGSAGHRAEGKVESVDAKAGTVSIQHGPVASLKWPAMTMEFKLANASLAAAARPGANVRFEFVERSAGEWVVTSMSPSAASPPLPPPRDAPSIGRAHTGH